MTRIGVVGLGEAGTIYASAVAAAGHETLGYDPVAPSTPDGVERVAELSSLLARAELVIVLTGAAQSPDVAAAAGEHLAPGAILADFTTASPGDMQEAEAVVVARGGRFVDVAILGPVPTKGAATETIVSGDAAEEVAALLRSLGSDVEVAEGSAGVATSRKLLRSVMMKSLATVVIEALEAGRAAGCEAWVHAQIAAQLSGDADAKIARYERGSRTHAVRRAHEMESVVDYLGSLGVESTMSAASRIVLERLARESA